MNSSGLVHSPQSTVHSPLSIIHRGIERATISYRLSTKCGFTLIELLISVMIFALVGTAVYSIFACGIIAWRKGSKDKTYVRKVRLAAESLAKDLRNTFEFSEIAFEGREDSVQFAALILNEPDPEYSESESYYEVGRAAYFYDKGKKTLYREEIFFPAISQEREEGDRVKVLIRHLRKLEFSYCYLDNVTGSYKWKDDWKKEEQDTIPAAVRIKMVFKKEVNQRDFEKMIFIPIGTGEQRIELR